MLSCGIRGDGFSFQKYHNLVILRDTRGWLLLSKLSQPCYLAGYEGMASPFKTITTLLSCGIRGDGFSFQNYHNLVILRDTRGWLLLSKISQPCYLAGYEGMASPFKTITTLLSCGIRGDGFSFQKYQNLVILRDMKGRLLFSKISKPCYLAGYEGMASPFKNITTLLSCGIRGDGFSFQNYHNLVILRDTRGWLLLSKISQPCYLAGYEGMASPFKNIKTLLSCGIRGDGFSFQKYHNLVILRDTRGWLLLSKLSQPCYLAGYEGMASPFKNITTLLSCGIRGDGFSFQKYQNLVILRDMKGRLLFSKISKPCYLAGYEGMASPFKNITTLLSCGIRGDGFSFQKYQNLVILRDMKGRLLFSKISKPCYLAGYEGMASPFKNITTLLSCGIRGDGFSFQNYHNLVILRDTRGWLLLSKISQPCYLAGYEGMASPFKNIKTLLSCGIRGDGFSFQNYHNLVILRDTRGWLLLSKISQPCYLAGYEGMASPFKNIKTLLSCGIRGDGFSFQNYHNLVILRDTRGWLLLSKISQPCYLAGYEGMASPFKNIKTLLSCGIRGDGFSFQKYHNLVILRDTRGWLLLSKISQPCYLAGYEGMASPFKNIKTLLSCGT